MTLVKSLEFATPTYEYIFQSPPPHFLTHSYAIDILIGPMQ